MVVGSVDIPVRSTRQSPKDHRNHKSCRKRRSGRDLGLLIGDRAGTLLKPGLLLSVCGLHRRRRCGSPG
jgi:hypothetical protein